ncbi:hypothetical protein OBBRIDRAFT_888520 [Obba rivulosa]|uniref:Uncharacterized protein n=1 Tax=Obba rivulosa TaxID=1052685 RepID=A0A8E2B143_9APHY|nr:hypothetical protein OBBRIDRAFT_888520 [Obba rivulosa]
MLISKPLSLHSNTTELGCIFYQGRNTAAKEETRVASAMTRKTSKRKQFGGDGLTRLMSLQATDAIEQNIKSPVCTDSITARTLSTTRTRHLIYRVAFNTERPMVIHANSSTRLFSSTDFHTNNKTVNPTIREKTREARLRSPP